MSCVKVVVRIRPLNKKELRAAQSTPAGGGRGTGGIFEDDSSHSEVDPCPIMTVHHALNQIVVHEPAPGTGGGGGAAKNSPLRQRSTAHNLQQGGGVTPSPPGSPGGRGSNRKWGGGASGTRRQLLGSSSGSGFRLKGSGGTGSSGDFSPRGMASSPGCAAGGMGSPGSAGAGVITAGRTFTFDKVFDSTLPPPQPSAVGSSSSSRSLGVDGKQEKGTEETGDDEERGKEDSAKLYASQAHVYESVGVDVITAAFEGYNFCVFAYGQTGAGKSYTMMGSVTGGGSGNEGGVGGGAGMGSNNTSAHEEFGSEALGGAGSGDCEGEKNSKGLIPRICEELFRRIRCSEQENLERGSFVKFSVEATYFEIYNERVRDLIDPQNKSYLRVREHPVYGPFVEDLSVIAVESVEDIFRVIDEGNKARTVAATRMNESSSRSHAVFTLTFAQSGSIAMGDGDGQEKGIKRGKDGCGSGTVNAAKVSKISLVDLAGSERADSTGATGEKLKEGANINRSLTTLGKVISALAERSSKGKGDTFIPYRDSVLTWLLKESLGGNSKTTMIAAVSPSELYFDETLSTLRYAYRAKSIVNKAVVNEDPKAKLIRELRAEVMALKAKLDKSGRKPSATGAGQEGSVEDRKRVEDLKDQLDTSRKVMDSLNQTWEEKVRKAHLLQKMREEMLEEMGISLNVQSNTVTGVFSPKVVPHLVNLNEDPMMSECLVYYLSEGAVTTTVGSAKESHIQLSGEDIQPFHCVFEVVDDHIVIKPEEYSMTYINGHLISSPKQLRSGYRIALGKNHIFRFQNPLETRANSAPGDFAPFGKGADSEGDGRVGQLGLNTSTPVKKGARDQKLVSDPEDDLGESVSRSPSVGDIVDWDYAKTELSKFQSENEAIWAEKLKSMERKLEEQEREAVERLERQREKYEEKLSKLEGSLSMLTNTPPGDKSAANFMSSKANTTADSSFQNSWKDEDVLETSIRPKGTMDTSIASTTSALDKSSIHLEGSRRVLAMLTVKRWESFVYVSLRNTIYKYAALVKEANAVSKELQKNVWFQFIMQNDNPFPSLVPFPCPFAVFTSASSLATAARSRVGVCVMDLKNGLRHMWSIEKLCYRIQAMRELYYTSMGEILCGNLSPSSDPFYDPPTRLRLVGYCFLKNLLYGVPLQHKIPLMNESGNRICTLTVGIVPLSCAPPRGDSTASDDFPKDEEELEPRVNAYDVYGDDGKLLSPAEKVEVMKRSLSGTAYVDFRFQESERPVWMSDNEGEGADDTCNDIDIPFFEDALCVNIGEQLRFKVCILEVEGLTQEQCNDIYCQFQFLSDDPEVFSTKLHEMGSLENIAGAKANVSEAENVSNGPSQFSFSFEKTIAVDVTPQFVYYLNTSPLMFEVVCHAQSILEEFPSGDEALFAENLNALLPSWDPQKTNTAPLSPSSATSDVVDIVNEPTAVQQSDSSRAATAVSQTTEMCEESDEDVRGSRRSLVMGSVDSLVGEGSQSGSLPKLEILWRAQVKELGSGGEYLAVPVERSINNASAKKSRTIPSEVLPMFQLRQGMQRRVVLNVTLESSPEFEMQHITGLSVDSKSGLKRVCPDGSIIDVKSSKSNNEAEKAEPLSEIDLKITKVYPIESKISFGGTVGTSLSQSDMSRLGLSGPVHSSMPSLDFTSDVLGSNKMGFEIEAAWDSSLLKKKGLNYVTPPDHFVSLTFYVYVQLQNCIGPTRLARTLLFRVHESNHKFAKGDGSSSGFLSFLFGSGKKSRQNADVNSPGSSQLKNTVGRCLTSLFEVSLNPVDQRVKPHVVQDTSKVYVRGEENLGGWLPATPDIIDEYHTFRLRLCYVAEVQRTKQYLALLEKLGKYDSSKEAYAKEHEIATRKQNTENSRQIMERALVLWQKRSFDISTMPKPVEYTGDENGGFQNPSARNSISADGRLLQYEGQAKEMPLFHSLGHAGAVKRGWLDLAEYPNRDFIPQVMKGYPNFALYANERWALRKWVVIRRPYFCIYNSDAPGEPEIDVINISKVKIRSSREIARLLPTVAPPDGGTSSTIKPLKHGEPCAPLDGPVFSFDIRNRGFLVRCGTNNTPGSSLEPASTRPTSLSTASASNAASSRRSQRSWSAGSGAGNTSEEEVDMWLYALDPLLMGMMKSRSGLQSPQ